jgi:hypothetical protein
MALFFICDFSSDTSHILVVILSVLVTEESKFADFIFEHKNLVPKSFILVPENICILDSDKFVSF